MNITDHAAERYVERVKPGFTVGRARWEMNMLLKAGFEVCDEPPAWCSEQGEPGRCYVEVTDGVCFVVAGSAVTTVLVRCGKDVDGRRAEKRKRKAERRKARELREKKSVSGPVRFDRAQARTRKNDWGDAA